MKEKQLGVGRGGWSTAADVTSEIHLFIAVNIEQHLGG
jgi:hypothetical protein